MFSCPAPSAATSQVHVHSPRRRQTSKAEHSPNAPRGRAGGGDGPPLWGGGQSHRFAMRRWCVRRGDRRLLCAAWYGLAQWHDRQLCPQLVAWFVVVPPSVWEAETPFAVPIFAFPGNCVLRMANRHSFVLVEGPAVPLSGRVKPGIVLRAVVSRPPVLERTVEPEPSPCRRLNACGRCFWIDVRMSGVLGFCPLHE